MKNLSFWKKSVYSALVFFGTLMVLSVGYALLSSGLSNADKVGSGSGLTASSWNHIIDGVFELDTRTANISSSGGNVGIGTTSPGVKLTVDETTAGDSRTIGTFQTTSAGRTPRLDFKASGVEGGTQAMILQTGSPLAAYPNLILQPTGGNVGIGTASPQAPLQINGPATSGVQYAMNVIGGAAVAWTDGIAIKIGPSTTGQYGSRIVSYSNSPSSYGSRLQLQTHDTSATNQSFNTGLLIDESGNVGIGTTSPTQKLDVNGLIGIHSTVTTSLIGNIRMENDLFKIVTPSQKQWDFRDDGTIWFYNGSIWVQKNVN
ncbi:MAG: hypothetical protein PHN60_01110 [Candidatus Gracilibacteria bacterium]|nr:hypothetical protein [Candidatus Gracilibacteria bacterium]